MRILAAVLAVSLAACAAKTAVNSTPPAGARTMASAGVQDGALADLLERHWDWLMVENPRWATRVGDHRFDDQLSDESQAHRAERRERLAGFVREAEAFGRAKRAELSDGDALTLDLFLADLRSALAVDEACNEEEWLISASVNPVDAFNNLPDFQPVTTTAEAAKLLARYRAIPEAIETHVANLRLGVANGQFANATSVKVALAMVDAQLAQPDLDWPLYAPAKVARAGWSEDERAGFARDVAAAIVDIRVATTRWRGFVATEVLPHARPDDKAGIGAIPGGAVCYGAHIAEYTTVARSAEELHQLGLSEIARIDAEIIGVGDRLFGTRDLAKIVARLRTDPSLYFKSEDEVEAKAVATLAAAKAAIPRFFGILPKAECVVKRVPAYQAPYTTIAYYEQPNPDGSKPGEYFINTSQPTTRPKYEAEALAFHESIPGHHLQLAIAIELPEVPAFRRFGGTTAFVEGWGLYAERLAGEMGLYTDDLARMGALSFEAWRAARLVVDTGIHAKGWTREQAVAFMLEHTALAENNVRNEVDRYVGWPGQALAYKVGQLTILSLRRDAEAELDRLFDLKAFHDVVLGAGPVTLPILEARVAHWVGEVKARSQQ